MEHNIGIYDCPFNIQGHEDARLYHKASLGIVEDERYNLPKNKSKNFFMDIGISGQTLYWNEVVIISPQKVQL